MRILGKREENMKKIVATLVTALIALAAILDGYWILFPKKEVALSTSTVTSQASQSKTTANTVSSSASSSTQSKSGYKDGTYTGSSISTQWGDVQTQVTISGGKITEVQALKYPDSNNHSQSINSQVIPEYTQETISADSAKIQAISGATVTYGGYTSSLQSALDQAV